MSLSRAAVPRWSEDELAQLRASLGEEAAAALNGATVARQRAWTTSELTVLRRMVADGEPVSSIAVCLKRSELSVKRTAYRQRISLRPAGVRTGLTLGQPRSASWADARRLGARHGALLRLRAEILDGTVDVADLERIARRAQMLARGAALCPSCTRNPQEVDSTGLCADCHLDALAEAHAHETIHRQSLRNYNAEKQRAKRRRDREQESPDDVN